MNWLEYRLQDTPKQPNFGPFSPYLADNTASITERSTLLPSCDPRGIVVARSELKDHFGSGSVLIWAAMLGTTLTPGLQIWLF